MDADKQGFKILQCKVKWWVTNGKLILFYNASNASQWWTHKFCAARLVLAHRSIKLWSELADHVETCLMRLSQYLLETLPCRSMDPQGAAWISCRPVALNRLRSRLVQKLVGLSKAWGTVECLFCSLGRNLKLARWHLLDSWLDFNETGPYWSLNCSLRL